MELGFIFKKQVHQEFKTIQHKNNQEHYLIFFQDLPAHLNLPLGSTLPLPSVIMEYKSLSIM